MTKKNYVKAANIVQTKQPKKIAKELENSFVELFTDDNPRFDEEKFRYACNREVR